MSKPVESTLRAVLLLTLAVGLTAGRVQAQEPQTPADTAAPALPDEPEPLPGAVEVPTQWSQLADSAAIAEQVIEQLGRTDELAADLNAAARREADLQALLGPATDGGYVRPERISRLRDQAVLERQRLDALRDRILERLEQLGELRSQWVARQAFWERWENELRDDPDISAVAPDLGRADARIDSVLARISTTLNGLLQHQRTVEGLRADNDRLLDVLTAMVERGRAALLERGQPVLFSATHRAQLAEGGWRAWRPATALRPATYGAFVRDHAGLLLFHILLAAALGLIARRLQTAARRVGGWSGLLEHPWLLGTFASVVLLLQRVLLAPPLWDVLVWSIFAGAAAVLARQLFAAYALRLTVYLFAGFYPLFLLFEALRLPGPVFRTALAAIAAVALPGFALLARRRTVAARAEDVSDPRRIWPLRIGTLLWAVVLVAVITGYDALGRWIVHTTLTSAAVILVVIILLALVRGAVASLVISDPGIRRHLALRVAVRLAQRLILIVQVVTIIAAVLVLLDVWQITGPPFATWQRIIDAGFDAGPIRITIGSILLGILVIYIAVVFSWLVRNIVESEVYRRWDFDRGVGDSINKLVHYALITIGVIVALAVLGVELRNFAIVAGALGIGIGFGLQNVVSNFASGLILLFERPVRVGDTVVVGGEWGTIRKIGLRSTIMLTFDQSEMIVPNADLVSEKVVNWTLSNPTARFVIEVGVAYGSDIGEVLRIMHAAGEANEFALSDPPPLALFVGFGDSSLDFELRVWVKAIENRLQVRSAILADIDQRFREAGIEIPFPQRDLHVRSVDRAVERSFGRAGERE